MKLLTQGDDFGFTRGVTLGIVDSIDQGVLRNTGLFANMPSAPFAVSFMKDRPFACFGIDFNIVAGPSCADPAKIPHLIDENGLFIKSGTRIRNELFRTPEGREEMFPLEEVYTELRAQYDRFVEMTGRKPGYLHPHSIHPETYMESIRRIAEDEHVPFSHDIREAMGFREIRDCPAAVRKTTKASGQKVFDPAEQINKNTTVLIMQCADWLAEGEYAAIGGHPGYVDGELMKWTTLSLERMRDAEAMMSEEVRNWIDENQIELITYYDLI